MDYEKLRLAKEALDSGSYDRETIEYIFPELKESEDERIKTFLHHTFTAQYLCKDKLGKWHGEPVVNILAWLEKYGEKSKWSEEDESVLRDIKEAVASYWYEDTENVILDWLESLKKRMKEKTMRFRKGNIITNGKIEYEIRDIQKNQLGNWVYILYNDNIAKLLSNDSHLPDGSIRWICEQVDGEFELKQRMEEQ